MNDPLDDGGPVYPQTRTEDNGRGYGDKHTVFYPGVSLRDWFAGQFLAGIANNADLDSIGKPECAAHAYEMADAMIAARKEKP